MVWNKKICVEEPYWQQRVKTSAYKLHYNMNIGCGDGGGQWGIEHWYRVAEEGTADLRKTETESGKDSIICLVEPPGSQSNYIPINKWMYFLEHTSRLLSPL